MLTNVRARSRQRFFFSYTALFLLGLAWLLPGRAQAQEVVSSRASPFIEGEGSRSFSGFDFPASQRVQGVFGHVFPTKSVLLAQAFRKKWTAKQWLIAGGIGGGVLLVIIVVAAKANQKKMPTQTASPDIIGGYRMQNLMMTGQTSQVWEVVEAASGRHFAVKLLLPEKVNDPQHRRLLFHEAEVGMKLAHPNIIKIIKFSRDLHNPYMVMEFFPAGNLKIRIMHKEDHKEFIREKAHDIFKQAATALAFVNANGWVHRDVKPDNILVNSAGEVRIIDFALAQRISKGGLFRRKKGKAAGTRSYMSPEQIRGEGLDARADIYSFGASMYEVVTGRPPFRAGSPTELLNKHFTQKPDSPKVYNPDVTDEFADLVLRMLAKKKQDRPKDFHEVLMALRNIQVFKGEMAKKTL
jgi:serine/threonine protein kinase